jgi:hypothetical protein
MYFDHETEAVEVRSPYTHPALMVRVKRPGPLFVRIPEWAAPDEVVVRGTPEAPRSSGGYLLVPQPPVDAKLTFEFPLKEREIVLEHRTRRIRARLRGEEVVAMENFGADLTYFEPLV